MRFPGSDVLTRTIKQEEARKTAIVVENLSFEAGGVKAESDRRSRIVLDRGPSEQSRERKWWNR